MIRPVLALAAFLALGAAAQAGDVSSGYAPVYGLTSPCDDGKLLHDVVSRFGWAENGTFGTGIQIARLDLVHQTGFAPSGPGLIERRYCQASATLNNGQRPIVYYLIESNQGFVGLGSRVEFCVDGYDRWHVHDGACRTVRPQ